MYILMSYITNQAINSRSMNGILTITDGTAILEDGKLECENINVKTATITSLSDSNLVNCTTSTIASQDDDLVNKKYVVDNFVDRTNNLTQDISGLKTFTNNVTISNLSTFQPTLTFKASSGTTQQGLIRMEGSSFKLLNNSTTPNIAFTLTNNTRLTISPTQFLLDATCFLTTNDMKSRAPTLAHTLLSDISTGTLAISSATATNTINGATQTNQQITFNNFTPICSVATPTANNHLVRKDYVDNNFVNLSTAQNIYGSKYFGSRVQLYGGIALDVGPGTSTFAGVVSFNAQIYFVNLTPICYINPTDANHLTRKEYVDTNFMFKTNNVVENINGVKTFTNRINCNGTTSLVVAGIAQFDGTATFSSTLTSNNITAPIVLGGTNNIFTNLDTFTGGAIINIGAKNNNINVKCNLNINESAYLTGSQNTLIWMEGNSSRFENQNSTNGNYIFTIKESGTFNPLVINKTSVDIGGDAFVGGNLYLNDTIPLSTLSMSVGVIGNDMTFDPENTTNTTYKFKVTDGSSPTPITSTALTISSNLTTINTPTTITELLTCKNLELSYVGDAHINSPNATGLHLFLGLTTQTIELFSNLTSAIVNFCSSSVFTTIFNINARIKHKQFQYLNEVITISSTSATLSLPLEQTIMLTSTGSTGVNITLPTLTLSTQAGFTFNVIKTGSITNTITFTASGSNLIRTYGSITGTSTAVAMGGIETIINIFTLEVSAGNFVWQIY